MKTFKFYSDSGHGWLAVKEKLIHELGLMTKISAFSYQKGKTVYLEEDLDMPLFKQAYEFKYGLMNIFEINHGDRSYIRAFDSVSNNEYNKSEFIDVALTDENLDTIVSEVNSKER